MINTMGRSDCIVAPGISMLIFFCNIITAVSSVQREGMKRSFEIT